MPSWSALAEARSAVGHKPISPDPANAIEAVLRIADAWDVNILARWKQEAMLRPEAFRQIVAREKGVLMNGIFAIAYKGQIAFAVSPISFQGGDLSANPFPGKCRDLCSLGQTDVISSHLNQKGLFEGPDQLNLAIGLVDLTEKEDTTGTVGGPIDALELLTDGKINWEQKKPGCPDSQD